MRRKDWRRRTEFCMACAQWVRLGHGERCDARIEARRPRVAAFVVALPAVVLAVGLALLR
jgi:hypothetical protein